MVIHFFFFFLIFSRFYLPDLKIRLSWKKVKDQRTTNICCQTLSVDLRIGRKIYTYIYTNPGRLKNKSPREKKAEKLVDRSLSLTMEQSVRPWRKRKSWKSFLSGKHIYHGRITVKAREFSRFSRFSILLWQGRFTTRGSSNIFDGG